MAEVMQTVPDGKLCATLVSHGIEFRCVFLDKGGYFQHDVGSGFNCRRHAGYEMAVEHTDEGRHIHKCPPCLKETT